MKIVKKDKRTKLDIEIEEVLDKLRTMDKTSDDYKKLVDNLDVLVKMRNCDKTSKISKDTLVIVGANLLGIIIIVGYEQAHIVTSKAFSMLTRGRV